MQHRISKALLVGTLCFAMRIPTDWALWKCSANVLILPYAVTLQVMDAAIIVYLFYKLLLFQIRRPWKCQACDGWGRRFFVPGDSKDHQVQLEKCTACNGTGHIWEITNTVRLGSESS